MGIWALDAAQHAVGRVSPHQPTSHVTSLPSQTLSTTDPLALGPLNAPHPWPLLPDSLQRPVLVSQRPLTPSLHTLGVAQRLAERRVPEGEDARPCI